MRDKRDNMAENEGFNGWSNWATWNVALWFDNNESLYRRKEHIIKFHNEDADDLASAIKRYVESCFPLFGDLNDGDFKLVDYLEIAQNWIED